ncbi:SUKH-4 family immunity protein [Nonomuraea terrae]|uniref:SUKH-4 family immunity protein n=1 Tax=Nonomuraea terrae TaxID=2530383 RepID=UPI00378C982A
MDVPRDLPPDLSGAFQVVGLPWPDVRLGHFDGVLAELGDHPKARKLRDHVRVLGEIQESYFEDLRDLADEHDGDTMRLIRHKGETCVTEVRERWAVGAERMAEAHAVVVLFTRRLVGAPLLPDYLAGDMPAWVERRPDRGIRGEPTAGRAPAAEALLRWRDDPYGPRICVVTGSPASGKTRLLAWFNHATLWRWSGYPDPREAAVCLRGMDAGEAVAEVAGQLKIDDLAGLDQPALVTLADLHRSTDPERVLTDLVRPLAADRHARLLLEGRDAAAVIDPEEPVFVLDLDDPSSTDRDAFTAWYAAERSARSPFTADQVYPSPGLAAFAARAEGADPGPDMPLSERVAHAWLDGLSPDARAAAGTLALAFAPIGPYTWRLLHCGRHRHDPEAAARGVAEAAARLPLAEPGLPAYVIDLPALAQAVAPPEEAHAELAAVMRGWPVADELPPPEYVSRHLPRHERGAPRPPLPLCRPKTRVTRDLLLGLYGPAGVVRHDELHPAITHEPTRRFLTEIGLPGKGVHETGFTGDDRRFAVPMSEWWAESAAELLACEGLPGDLGALFMLDFLDSWSLFLDGSTGLVYEVHESLESARVAHRDVESYTYFVYVIHRERRLWCDGPDAHPDASYWCAEDLALELHTYEPQAMAGDDALWPPTLLDYTLLT